MYHIDTFSTRIHVPSFGATISLPASLFFASSLLPVRSVLLTNRPCDHGTITRGLLKQPVATPRDKFTVETFDAIFRVAWLILPDKPSCLRILKLSPVYSPGALKALPHCPDTLHVKL